MKKTYNPSDIEQQLYEYWERRGYFKPNKNKNEEFYCIMIPPPNITGGLHMGHAFQQTIIDTMIRYQRMKGKNTLCQVGTDHAGIAAQILMERKIATEEGKTRYDYDRNEFIKKIWQWKIECGDTIARQIRRLGNSVDWERERFTLDKGFSKAVKEVFIRLYRENLIYRGKRLVNWDLKLQTAISDLEVENRESRGSIWYIRYPLADGIKTLDGKNYLTVSTTRPETMLGDTGVAVNRKDPRYKQLIGKFVILPIVNRRIPIIGDECADIEKGTGCVKITPAHDFNDYEVGRRHQLPMINILTLDGNIRENAEVFDTKGKNICFDKIPTFFQKIELSAARKVVLSCIDSLGLLEDVKPHDLTIPYSERSGTIIEPILTDQWYVRTDMLTNPAIEAVKNGDIKFFPKQYENMYLSWMHNIKDWCISRQLWWGHRIPAWYDKHGNVYVGHSEVEVRQVNNLSIDTILYQDEDVLDTWFSSALWTFSALGWPEKTEDLIHFHPTDMIVSGFDIIFFWIARMIMMTMHFIKNKNGKPQIPFKVIYITGLIRDEERQKMSKSKSNVIDPLDMIDGISLSKLIEKRIKNIVQPQLIDKIRIHTEKHFPNGIKSYGADALRFTLLSLASTCRNIKWDMKRLEGYRNFCNKLWNASRFVLMNTEGQECGFNGEEKVLAIADRWILTELNYAIKSCRKALDNFRFDIAARILHKFTWDQFCDWYIELSKLVIRSGSEKELRGTRYTLIIVLEALLRLQHPIIPFITETIWQHVKLIAGIKADTIMLQPFPKFEINLIDKSSSSDIEWLKQVIVAIRAIRIDTNISNKPIRLLLRNCSDLAIRRINENQRTLKTMACLENISILPDGDKGPVSITRIVDGAELLIPALGIIDKTAELKRLYRKLGEIEVEISRVRSKLAKEDFITYAPEIVISKERKKLKAYIDAKAKIIEQQAVISNL